MKLYTEYQKLALDEKYRIMKAQAIIFGIGFVLLAIMEFAGNCSS